MTVLHKGIKWPSPSNIISDVTDKSYALTQWAANMVCEWIRNNCEEHKKDMFEVTEEVLKHARFNFKNVSERAMDVGTQAHDAVRMWLQAKTKPSSPDDEVKAAFEAFLEFEKENDMVTEKMEERLFLDNWCMQYDWYGKFNGELYLIDFKTSKAFYRDMRIQTAAYRFGLQRKGNTVVGHGVIRLDKKTGKPEWKDYSKFYAQDLNEFMLAKELYFARHPRIAKPFIDTLKPF